ncbi:MAG: methylenetetrahydrofolate reductase C-terminal domain-containing protein [Nitrospirota bacterium]
MVVAEIKPFVEIKEMLKNFKKVLIVGCGTCMAVCLSGGKKQVELLATALRAAKRTEDDDEILIGERTVGRQCEPRFVEQLKDEASQYEAILSMGCGAGVQEIVERLRPMLVLPAMNTKFIGASDSEGVFAEMCAACGDCILSLTGGICPLARCPKGLLNGPCGGTKNGRCEVSSDIPCAWVMIYERMKELGKLDDLKKAVKAKDWSKTQRPGVYKAHGEEQAK